MKYLSGGTTRDVFLVGPWALKIPKLTSTWGMFLQGLLGNMQETAFSTLKAPEYCPVLWSAPGGFLVIMPRADPLTADEWDAFSDGFEPIEPVPSWTRPGQVVPCVEPKRDSFGRLNGHVVAVDYGS